MLGRVSEGDQFYLSIFVAIAAANTVLTLVSPRLHTLQMLAGCWQRCIHGVQGHSLPGCLDPPNASSPFYPSAASWNARTYARMQVCKYVCVASMLRLAAVVVWSRGAFPDEGPVQHLLSQAGGTQVHLGACPWKPVCRPGHSHLRTGASEQA